MGHSRGQETVGCQRFRSVAPMTMSIRTLVCFTASAAICWGTPAPIAAKPPARAAQHAGSLELSLQVLLDRADFSPGEIDGGGGQNSRRALAAFEAAHELAPGVRGRKALLEALGADTVEPIVSYTITAEDAAGPFSEAI